MVSEGGREATSDARRDLARAIRMTVLDASKRANVGHIGSCLSVADILAALYTGTLSGAGTGDRDRDRFILSKGHAALALYAALHEVGILDAAALESFCGEGSALGTHPEHGVPGVDFATGSLGMGLSMGAGAALAARLDGSERRVYVLMSDAECNEGSVWEAIMFAAHHRLSNLVAIVDVNGQQAFGYTEDVLDLAPLDGRWRSFGWGVHAVDGNDPDACARVLARLRTLDDGPQVLLARTVFGKGVSFMESQIKWHYWPLDDDEYAAAASEVEGAA